MQHMRIIPLFLQLQSLQSLCPLFRLVLGFAIACAADVDVLVVTETTIAAGIVFFVEEDDVTGFDFLDPFFSSTSDTSPKFGFSLGSYSVKISVS